MVEVAWRFFLIQLHKVVCQAFTECTGFSKT